jgi:hypothetical protein
MIAASLAAALLAADPSVVFDGSVRDEVRAGTAVALGGANEAPGAENVLIPDAQGSWRSGENLFVLRYDPQLMTPDFGEGNHLEVLHRGQAQYAWTSHTQFASVLVSEEAEYGIVDIFALTPPSSTSSGLPLPEPGPVPSLQAIPNVIGINYEASNSVVDFRWGASRRTTFDVSGGYRLSGGADTTAQASLPLEQGPFASASLIYAASRRDTLTSRVSATDLRFSNGPNDLLLELDQEGSRRLAQHLLGTLGLGVGALQFQANPGAPSTYTGYPEASASLIETLPITADRTFSAGVTASVAPLIDRLGGTVFESFQVVGRLEWTTPQGFSIRGLAGFGEPLYGNLTAAQQLELAQGAIAYQPVKFLRIEAGGLGSWQQPSNGLPATTQWLAFGALVLQETVQK